MDYLFLLLGFAILIIGGELLVRGAVGMALKAGLSALVVGMTIVSFGTSSPELLVCIKAAMQPGDGNLMSVGNIVGSNIANLTLVLGITAIVSPIAINVISLKRDWPFMFGSSLLAAFFMRDLSVSRMEGVILFILLIVFTVYLLQSTKQDKSEKEKSNKDQLDENNNNLDSQEDTKGTSTLMNVMFILIGVAGLTFGSDLLVESASSIATSYGISPFVIGVTVLAFGTSVPELATSAIAAYKKETDLAIGNLLGSNIFNILSVLGVTAMISPVKLTADIFSIDLVWMILSSVAVFILMFHKRMLARTKGIALFAIYLSYVAFLLVR